MHMYVQGYPTTILMSGPPQPLAPQPLTYVGVYPSQQSPYLTNPDPLSPTMLQSPQVQNQSQRNLNHVNIWNGNGGGSPHMLSNGAGSSHMLGPNGCSDGKDAFLCSPGPPIRSSDRFKGPKGILSLTICFMHHTLQILFHTKYVRTDMQIHIHTYLKKYMHTNVHVRIELARREPLRVPPAE
jgi:hypothetical protein